MPPAPKRAEGARSRTTPQCRSAHQGEQARTVRRVLAGVRQRVGHVAGIARGAAVLRRVGAAVWAVLLVSVGQRPDDLVQHVLGSTDVPLCGVQSVALFNEIGEQSWRAVVRGALEAG